MNLHFTVKSSLLNCSSGLRLAKQPKSFGHSRMLLNLTSTTLSPFLGNSQKSGSHNWPSSRLLQKPLKNSVVDIVWRLPRSVIGNVVIAPLPLQRASELSGIAEADLIGVVVAAIGERTEILSASRLFSLVGLLASQLSHDEALDALNFGLGLFDEALDEKRRRWSMGRSLRATARYQCSRCRIYLGGTGGSTG